MLAPFGNRAARAGGRPAGAGHPRLPASDRTTFCASAGARPSGLARPWLGERAELGARPTRSSGCKRAARQHRPRPSRCCWSAGASAACSRANMARDHPDEVRAVVTLGSPFSGDPQAEQCVAALRMGRRAPGRRPPIPRITRQAAGADIWRSGRGGTAIVAARSARGLDHERDKAVELDCDHMAFGVSRRGDASDVVREIRTFLDEMKAELHAPSCAIDSRASCETRTKVEQKRCELCGRRLVPGRRRKPSPRAPGPASSLPSGLAPSAGVCLRRRSPTLVRTVRRPPARRRLGRVPAGPGRPAKPLLWVQDRMAILESGRVYPPGLPSRTSSMSRRATPGRAVGDGGGGKMRRRCPAVIGELWGDPRSARFHRDAAAGGRGGAQRRRRAGWCGWAARANLSGARMRWRIASAPSLVNTLDPRAPGAPAWDAELFRARGMPPGRWSAHA